MYIQCLYKGFLFMFFVVSMYHIHTGVVSMYHIHTGVVQCYNFGRVKDMYLIPLPYDDDPPAQLLPFNGPGNAILCTVML